MDLLVLCPTRDRPLDARKTYLSFQNTKTSALTGIVFVIDDDQVELYGTQVPTFVVPKPGNMVAALNIAAAHYADQARIIGFVGDDHRFKTSNWDEMITDALDGIGGGIAYGNDLAQGANLPTQVFMDSRIIKAIGWMGLPTCHHLYIDNAWFVLGKELDRLAYLPDVVIEHLHPYFGKSEWDEGHLRVNSPVMYDHDREAFNVWISSGQAELDVLAARAAL